MTVDAVFFDFDDTLYPYEPCNEAGKVGAWHTSRDCGYDFDRETFETLYQTGRTDVKRELDGTAPAHERVLYFKRGLEIHTGQPQPADALALGDAYWDAYLEAMELYPTVEETLQTIANRGIQIGILTNLTTRIQLRKLEQVGIEEILDTLITSEEVGREKPASVMFTLGLARLDCQASAAMMIGDSLESDIRGANAVGIESVLFDPSGQTSTTQSTSASPAAHPQPDHRIEQFDEVLSLLE